MFCFFFFKQKTAYEMRISDWSSDVCSSDLVHGGRGERGGVVAAAAARRTADDPLPGRTAEHHALVRHVAGNTRLRLRAESVLWRGAGTAGRGLVPGVSANSPSPGLPGAWRRVAVNRKPTHDLARYDMAPATRAFGYVPPVSFGEGQERLAAARHRERARKTSRRVYPARRGACTSMTTGTHK